MFRPTLEVTIHDASVLSTCARLADDVQSGKIVIFDREAAWEGATPDWHADPVTGQRWPARYCFDIDYRNTAGRIGDVKYVWELNRLCYLLPVATTAAARGSRELAELCERHVVSWLRSNPPYIGIGWSGGIECATRLVVLVAVDEILGELAGDPFKDHVRSAVASHVRWIAAYPSRYSSANNHRLAELVGLIVAEARYPGAASTLARDAIDELESEALRQIHADGVSAEQATDYATYAAEWLTIGRIAAAVLGQPTSQAFGDRLRAALEFLEAVTDTADNTVVIGDDDEATVLSGLVARQHKLAFLWALNGWPRPARPRGLRTYPLGGYSVARDEVHGQEALWVFDHGPLGLGTLAAHGHADTLAIWLHLDGQPVFVDAGTYLYHAAGEWRDKLRASLLHNTLTVEGASSSVPSGPFNWDQKRQATGRLLGSHADREAWRIEADHDGYLEAFGVRHRRIVERVDRDTYRLIDRLDGGVRRSVRFLLLLAPGVTAEITADGWRLCRGQTQIATLAVTAPSPEAAATSHDPPEAWHSPHFGALAPAGVVVFDTKLGPADTLQVVIRLTEAQTDR